MLKADDTVVEAVLGAELPCQVTISSPGWFKNCQTTVLPSYEGEKYMWQKSRSEVFCCVAWFANWKVSGWLWWEAIAHWDWSVVEAAVSA